MKLCYNNNVATMDSRSDMPAEHVASRTNWSDGRLLHIHIAPAASHEMHEIAEARCVAGRGIDNLARILCATGLCGPTGLVTRIFSVYSWTGLIPWHALNTGSTVWCSSCLRDSRRCSNQRSSDDQRNRSPHEFPPIRPPHFENAHLTDLVPCKSSSGNSPAGGSLGRGPGESGTGGGGSNESN
jgi:hypothetical protein